MAWVSPGPVAAGKAATAQAAPSPSPPPTGSCRVCSSQRCGSVLSLPSSCAVASDLLGVRADRRPGRLAGSESWVLAELPTRDGT